MAHRDYHPNRGDWRSQIFFDIGSRQTRTTARRQRVQTVHYEAWYVRIFNGEDTPEVAAYMNQAIGIFRKQERLRTITTGS